MRPKLGLIDCRKIKGFESKSKGLLEFPRNRNDTKEIQHSDPEISNNNQNNTDVHVMLEAIQDKLLHALLCKLELRS